MKTIFFFSRLTNVYVFHVATERKRERDCERVKESKQEEWKKSTNFSPFRILPVLIIFVRLHSQHVVSNDNRNEHTHIQTHKIETCLCSTCRFYFLSLSCLLIYLFCLSFNAKEKIHLPCSIRGSGSHDFDQKKLRIF